MWNRLDSVVTQMLLAGHSASMVWLIDFRFSVSSFPANLLLVRCLALTFVGCGEFRGEVQGCKQLLSLSFRRETARMVHAPVHRTEKFCLLANFCRFQCVLQYFVISLSYLKILTSIAYRETEWHNHLARPHRGLCAPAQS